VGTAQTPVQGRLARGKTGASKTSTGGRDELAEASSPLQSADLAPAVGANLRRMRGKRGLSLERLAKASGVSRAMLCQIELSQSAPTINILWKIARALNVPFSALITDQTPSRTKVLTAGSAKVLRSSDGSF
jgi:DNA-binding XRE family transcriptional regulator